MPNSTLAHTNPEGVSPSPFYNHVSTITTPSKIIYTAGQIGRSPNGTIPTDYLEQVTLALENLRLCLESQGATARDIVKLTCYIVDYNSATREQAAPMYAFLGEGNRPPTTLVPVTALALPGLLFEIEAVASIPIL